MCRACENLVNRYYPHLSDEDKIDLLMSATAFPFAHPDTLEGQLRRLRKRTDGTLNGAKDFADRSMRQAHDFVMSRAGEEQ